METQRDADDGPEASWQRAALLAEAHKGPACSTPDGQSDDHPARLSLRSFASPWRHARSTNALHFRAQAQARPAPTMLFASQSNNAPVAALRAG